jgi:DNA-binding PadR family transcriptional regulator
LPAHEPAGLPAVLACGIICHLTYSHLTLTEAVMSGCHQPLAPRDLLILGVLATGEQHGYGIIRAVEERSGESVGLDPANLYRVLRRMRRDGWIRELAAAGDEGEERRRTYGITDIGRTLLRGEVDRLERLLRDVRPALADRG